jgi:hypothetical protein
MSGPGRRGRPRTSPQPGPQPGSPPLAWALLVIAAALVGGLAAAALVHTSLVIAVVVAVVVGVIAVVVFRSPARAAPPAPPAWPGSPAPERPTQESRAQESRAGFPDPRRQPSSPAPPQTDAVVELLPLQVPAGQNTSRPWWDAAAGPPPRPSSAAQRAPAPDLSSYLAATLIAQCPRCGAFRLDARQAQQDWDFRCQSCDYAWAWQPGTPWPPVRVMPGRRRGPTPSP